MLLSGAAALPGDDRSGYERADFTTRSRALVDPAGERRDLAALAASPPLGLPALSQTLDPARVDLGRQLFMDRRLSANGTLSCAMCHIPEQGFAQNELATPVGIEGRSVRRNAPTLLNVAYRVRLFLDGRETDLTEQIWSPLLAANEMGNPNRDAVLTRVRAEPAYVAAFATAYPGGGLTEASLGDALASYQRGLLAADSRFDRHLFGGQSLTDTERSGYRIFLDSGCGACHTVSRRAAPFTDEGFYNTGIGYARSQRDRQPRRVQIAPGVFTPVTVPVEVPDQQDLGRLEVTGNAADRWRYRVPSLRNVALTAPYMHDGSLLTLADVVAYYNAGGARHPGLDPFIRPLDLSSQAQAHLVAFLQTLTGSNVAALAADARSVDIGERGAPPARGNR